MAPPHAIAAATRPLPLAPRPGWGSRFRAPGYGVRPPSHHTWVSKEGMVSLDHRATPLRESRHEVRPPQACGLSACPPCAHTRNPRNCRHADAEPVSCLCPLGGRARRARFKDYLIYSAGPSAPDPSRHCGWRRGGALEHQTSFESQFCQLLPCGFE